MCEGSGDSWRCVWITNDEASPAAALMSEDKNGMIVLTGHSIVQVISLRCLKLIFSEPGWKGYCCMAHDPLLLVWALK